MGSIRRVKILGCGVIGLSTAWALNADYDVSVVAERGPQKTTSAVAAAFWEPFHVEARDAPVWWTNSYQHFLTLLGIRKAGISISTVRRLFSSREERDVWERKNPWYAMPELNYRPLDDGDVTGSFYEGMCYDVPVVHMPSYLSYLKKHLKAPIIRRKVNALADELADTDVLVNCTGLGSRTLADVRDRSLTRYRGQILIVKPPPDLKYLTFITTPQGYERHPFYAVKRGKRDLVLGGTYIRQYDDDTTPDERVTRQMIERFATHYPELQPIREADGKAKVGLRPVRRLGVRHELDKRTYAKPVIHNYGHGGGGVTLSWGCALAVRELLRTLEPATATVQ